MDSNPAAATNPELIATAAALAPDFAVQREIGRGGMGVVFLARDVRLDRPVAVKVLPAALAANEEIRERFLREARTAARLADPHIVPVYRADERDGVVFFVMPFIDGESLAERLRSRGTLPPREAIPILRAVALALDYAHERGVVHRDIKPENILLERGTGRALVTDFGIARIAEARPLTSTGQVLGTVHYMSPEQVSGEAIDGRSDMYSLGVVAYRTLSGRLPFESETASAVLVAHVIKAPPALATIAPWLPRPLSDVVERCLAKDPAARYASLGELVRALDDAAAVPTTMDVVPPVQATIVSEREAQALWARAAQLQALTGVQAAPPPAAYAPQVGGAPAAERRSLTSGYRMTDVRAAAEEAGISERYVERAAAELGLASHASASAPAAAAASVAPAIDDRPSAATPWLGASPSIAYDVVVPGEVPEGDYYLLAEIIRRRLGQPGSVSTLGRSLSWSSSSRNRNIQVSIVPRGGRTTIHVDERLGPLAGGLFGGIVGGGGGGSAGAAFGVGMGALHSLAAAFGIWGAAIGGTYLLARTIFRAVRRSRTEELAALARELAAQVAESTRQPELVRPR